MASMVAIRFSPSWQYAFSLAAFMLAVSLFSPPTLAGGGDGVNLHVQSSLRFQHREAQIIRALKRGDITPEEAEKLRSERQLRVPSSQPSSVSKRGIERDNGQDESASVAPSSVPRVPVDQNKSLTSARMP